jgi:hypothetical protein
MHSLKLSALAVFSALSVSFAFASHSAGTTSVTLPLTFERNDGQANPRYQFLSRHQGIQALFGTSGADFLLPAERGERRLLQMRYLDASAAVRLDAQEPLPGRDNYFRGTDPKGWRTQIPTYGEVSYQNLYQGIDLLFHGSADGSELEHDFVVQPGSDPGRIQFQLRGADAIRVGTDGALIVTVTGKQLTFHTPVAWQMTAAGRVPVTAAFQMASSSTIRFKVGEWDRTRPLTIDPVLAFATYLDGTGEDTITALATDSNNNIYVTGSTSSTDFPIANAEQSKLAGDTDVFIAKVDPTGHTLLYSTYLGGSNTDQAASIAVDSNGNVAVSGVSGSSDFPAAGKLSTTITTFTDTYNFIASLTAEGSALRYSGFIGETSGGYGDYNPRLNLVTFDTLGNAYVTGNTQADYPYTPGAYGGTPAPYPADPTLFIAKIENDGTIAYAATVPESQNPGPWGIGIFAGGLAVDSTGSVIVGGTAGNDLPVTSGVIDPTFPNDSAALYAVTGYVLKLNPSGSSLVFSTYLPGTDAVEGLAPDSSGNVYVSGMTLEANLPTSSNSFQPSFGNSATCDCYDGYVLQVSGDGTKTMAATYFNGSQTPNAISGPSTILRDLRVDAAGYVAVGGLTGAANLPLVNPLVSTFSEMGLPSEDDTLLVARFSPDLSILQFSTFLNAPDYAASYEALSTDRQNHIIVAGTTLSKLFPTTTSAFQAVAPGPANSYSLQNYQFIASIDPTTVAPSLCFDTTSVSFGTILVNAEANATVNLTNCGNASLTLSGLVSSSSLITASHDCTGVAPGSKCQVQLTYEPTALGTTMGTLAIAGNMGVSPQQVSFSGAAGAPSVSLPPSISFTGLLVGQTGAEASLGIYNVGNGPFILTSASVTGDYQIVTNGCTAPVAPNGSCQIVMNFSPSATGTRNGTLILNDNLTPSTQTIELIGQGLTSAPLPAITLIPAIAQITSGTGQIAVYGSGFMPNSTVYWNGSARATTYGGATVLIGTLSPSDLAKVGEATVTVGTPAPGGGTSAPAIATIFGQMPNLTILNEVYNLSTQLLYATVSSTSISNANSLVAIDPVAMQVVSTLLTGNNPDALAISGDGTLLYVGLDGLQSIAQLSLPSGTANFTVKVPEGGDTFLAQYGMMASALAVVPGQPHTWLLGICYLNTTPCGGGVAIFDDAVQRANIAFVQQLTANSLTFVNDPTVAYSTEFNQSPPNISSFSITSSGISLTATSPFEPGEGGGPLASDGKLLYVANGQVINPATLALEFTYPQGGSAFAIDIANQRLFFSGFSALYSFGGLDLTAVDQSTQATLGTIDFPEYGQAEDVRRFGTNGVVINNTWGGLIFVQTSLATIPVPPQLLTAAPATLTFAAQQQSTTSSAQNVVLTNGTSTAINLTSIIVTGDFAESTNCGSTLAANSSCAISVTFTPTIGGDHPGQLTIVDSGSPATLTVPLDGTGTAVTYTATVAPGSLTFASQTVGTTGAAQSVTLTNTGTGALAISSITATGDFAQTNNCGASVAAGATCAITVTFTPTASGTRPGLLNIADNATAGSQQVILYGTGAAVPPPLTYAATVGPGSLTFSSQTVGNTSAAQSVALTNTGTGTLAISSIATTGDFAQTNNCGSSLAPGAMCAIAVTFTPTTSGDRPGSLTITDNATAGPQQVTLDGTGATAAPPLTYAATVSPGSLTFQTQADGSTSSAQSVTLTNTGTGVLAISSIAVTGDFAQTNNCGTTLAAAATCSIGVTFTPTTTGDRPGKLTVTDNAAAGPQIVALDGNGAVPLSLAPTASGGNSVTVQSGSTATYNLSLTSAGYTGTVNLTCSGAPVNAACSITPASPNVTAGQAVPFTVTVTTNGQTASLPPVDNGFRFAGFTLIALYSIPLLLSARRRAGRLGLLALLLCTLCLAGAGCGGSNQSSSTQVNQDTAPGTYTITVTAAASNLSASEQLTLIVQ